MNKKRFKRKISIYSNQKILLSLIVLFGLILRLSFFSGMGLSDELTYSKSAYFFWRGVDPNSVLTLSTRIGLTFFTYLSYKLFGVNDFSSVLFVLLASLGSIVLAYFFGKLLLNEKAGLIAALLMSIFPMEVVYSTRLGSDLPSAFFMSLGVYVFLYAEKKLPKYPMYILSGILIGIAYLVRESALLIGLFFIAYIIYKRRFKKEYFLVPIGIILMFFLEFLLFYFLTGDMFFRLHVSQSYLIQKTIEHNYFGRLDFPKGLLHYPYIILTSPLLVFFYLAFFVALIYLIYNKKKETYVLMLWFLPLLLYLSFGSGSLLQYIPFRAVDRYLSIVTTPSILILAYFLALENIKIKKIITPLFMIILVASSIWASSLYHNKDLKSNLIELYNDIKNFDKSIYIDRKSFKALEYISRYNLNTNIKEYPKELSNVKDSYVVINKYTIKLLKESEPNFYFPKEVTNIPPYWKIIKEIGKSEEKILIYYVP